MLATKIEPKTDKVIASAIRGATNEMKKEVQPDWKGGFKIAGIIGAIAAFGAVVREVDRQRKELIKVKNNYEAVVSFTKVLIEETDCGKAAYVNILTLAEEAEDMDGEVIANWVLDDNGPTPYVVTESEIEEEEESRKIQIKITDG